MQSSESTTKIIPAFLKAQSDFEAVKRTVTNDFFGSKYATLDDILAMVRPILAKNNIAFMQPLETLETGETVIETRIYHTSGEWLSAQVKMPEIDQKGANVLQEFGISVTYMHRYTLSSFLGISVEDDNDGNKPRKKEYSKVENPGDIEVTFGKHNGLTISQIWEFDAGYVRWLSNNARQGAMRAAAAQYAQEKEAKPEGKSFDPKAVNDSTFGEDWVAMIEAAVKYLDNVSDAEKAKQAIKSHFEGQKSTPLRCFVYLRDEYSEEQYSNGDIDF